MSGEFVSDFRHVLRGLRRSPRFVAVAVLSLAIGIGANTSMFGVIRALLHTPLPVNTPDELALVGWQYSGAVSLSQVGTTDYDDPETGTRFRSNLSAPLYRELRAAAPEGVDLFAFAFLRGVSVASGNEPAVLAGGALADGAYFSTLGVPMALGRPLLASDDVRGAPLVAVLSHALWVRAFGGSPDVLGRTIRVNGQPAEVVGITARGFKGMSIGGFFPQTEITVPLQAQPDVYPRMGESLFLADNVFWLRVMARVPTGTSWTQTGAVLENALQAVPSPLVNSEDGILPVLRLLPGAEGAQPVGGETARLLYLLLGVVGIVLLIACVNLASLMLARGVGRQQEMAVRQALGAGRSRLIRYTLIESMVLAVVGTGVGLMLAYGSRGAVRSLLTNGLGSGAFGNVDMDVVIDPTLIALCATLGLAATVLFGLLPAIRLSGIDPVQWLRQRTNAGSGAPRMNLGRALIALQIAVSVPLVVGAVLFLRTVSNLGAVELGFNPTGIATFQLDPGFTQVPDDEYAALYQSVLERIEQVPGVRSVTLLENALMSGIISNTTITHNGERQRLYLNAVGPRFLETMGMQLVAGRMPDARDVRGMPNVGAVNVTAVENLFGGESPIGQSFTYGRNTVQIVGVVNDVPYRNQREPVPSILYPSAFQRDGYGGHHIVMRTEVPLGQLERRIREAVAEVNPDVPVPELRSQQDLIIQTSARERAFTQMLSLFGVFALLLASIGLHGVTAYWVARRTNEIGLRLAVGARGGQILHFVLRQVFVLTAIGLMVGIPASLAAGPLVGGLLYGVAPTDPSTVLLAGGVIFSVAVAAGFLPAYRATRMNPLDALRVE